MHRSFRSGETKERERNQLVRWLGFDGILLFFSFLMPSPPSTFLPPFITPEVRFSESDFLFSSNRVFYTIQFFSPFLLKDLEPGKEKEAKNREKEIDRRQVFFWGDKKPFALPHQSKKKKKKKN